MTTPDYNRLLKPIAAALQLRRNDIAECVRAGGVQVGNDAAARWMRHPDAGQGRYSPMTLGQFEAFCQGLHAVAMREGWQLMQPDPAGDSR